MFEKRPIPLENVPDSITKSQEQAEKYERLLDSFEEVILKPNKFDCEISHPGASDGDADYIIGTISNRDGRPEQKMGAGEADRLLEEGGYHRNDQDRITVAVAISKKRFGDKEVFIMKFNTNRFDTHGRMCDSVFVTTVRPDQADKLISLTLANPGKFVGRILEHLNNTNKNALGRSRYGMGEKNIEEMVKYVNGEIPGHRFTKDLQREEFRLQKPEPFELYL